MNLHIISFVPSCDNSAFNPDPGPGFIHIHKKLIEIITVNERFPVSLFDTNGNCIDGAGPVYSAADVEGASHLFII